MIVGSVLSTRVVRTGLVPVWPVPSVAIARRLYMPSASAVVSSAVVNGALTVAIVVQLPWPAGLRWSSTVAVSPSVETARLTVPRTFAPGSAMTGLGAVLSLVIVRVAEVVELPAASVATIWIECGPSETEALFQLVLDEPPEAICEPSTRKL